MARRDPGRVMNQTGVILAALFGAFVLNITAKGELSTYLGFFGVGPATGTPAPTGISAPGTTTTLPSLQIPQQALTTYYQLDPSVAGGSQPGDEIYGGWGTTEDNTTSDANQDPAG